MAAFVEAFPAHAGMNRQGLPSPESSESIPRACGDEPKDKLQHGA